MLSLLREHPVAITVRQASAAARADLHRLVSRAVRELTLLYEDTHLQIGDDLIALADAEGKLRAEELPTLTAKVDAALVELRRAMQELLLDGLLSAAEIAVDLWDMAGVRTTSRPLAEAAIDYVRFRQDEDGRKLADRLVRLERQTRRAVVGTLQQQIGLAEQAERASPAAQRRTGRQPVDQTAQALLQQIDALACSVGAALLQGEQNACCAMQRLAREEINRAHVEAYRAAMALCPDVVAERLIIEPHAGRRRIDEIQLQVNLYGLGNGVYPIGCSPWPRYGDALNFIDAVFADEAGGENGACWKGAFPN